MRSRLFVLATLVALLVAGCDWGDPPAATVDDRDIDRDLVIEFLQAAGQTDDQVRGEGTDTVSTTVASGYLDVLVELELIMAEVERRGLQIPEEARQEGRDRLISFLGGGEAGTGRPIFEALPDDVAERLVTLQAAPLVLATDLGRTGDQEAQARAFYDENPETFTLFCLEIMTFDGRAAAEEARAAVEGGIPFGDVARAQSIDDQAANGGNIGCQQTLSQLSQVVEPDALEAIGAASNGDLVGPLAFTPSQGRQFVVFRVGETQVVPFAQVRDQIIAQVLGTPGQAAIGEFVAQARREADVSVNPRFGRWDDEANAVIAPDGPIGRDGPAPAPPGPAPAPTAP